MEYSLLFAFLVAFGYVFTRRVTRRKMRRKGYLHSNVNDVVSLTQLRVERQPREIRERLEEATGELSLSRGK